MADKKLVEVEGVFSVTHKEGPTVEQKEKLGLVIKEGPVAEISCAVGMTKNLGNYQSARIDVSLKAPSNLDADSLDKTFEFVKDWCDTKLAGMLKELDESVG